MKIYNFLSENTVAGRKYALKFFLAAMPLVIVAATEPLVVLSVADEKTSVIIAAIVFILLAVIASITTLSLFKRLVSPIRKAKEALDNFLISGQMPQLPTVYHDEAGQLMSNIQSTITQLNELIIEKSDMIDLLSHDLRSPVGRILSLSNLIKDEDGEEKELYADYIINECRSLLSMLENLLLTLKEDSMEFRIERVNLDQLIRETTTFYDFAVSEKGINIDIQIPENIFIYVQRQLFTQAIRNILGNAIKFTPDGKSIRISGGQKDDQVSVTIKDEGLGLKPTDIQKIFNRFTTAGKRGTRGEASTGLGLYLSKKIVEKHGGRLQAESAGENMGASFTITLYTLITKKPQEKNGKKPALKKVMAVHQR